MLIVDFLKLGPMINLNVFFVCSHLNCLVSSSRELPDSDTTHVARAVRKSSSKNIGVDVNSLCRNMDLDGLRSYLIEHVNELKVLHEKVLGALKCAPDPGKLVLDGFLTFHKTFPDKDQIFDNKTCCLFLLEVLMKLSPTITPELKREAMSYASFLKAKFKGDKSPINSFGFLKLLAAFKIANTYDADELLSIFNIFYSGNHVYLPEENPYLCRSLGLSKKIPGMIFHFLRRPTMCNFAELL